jgi:hypothetical protein
MNKNFLTYLKESIALNLPNDEKKGQPLLIKSDEKSIRDIPLMKTDYDSIKSANQFNRKLKQERASILKKHNLKIENGEIKSAKQSLEDDNQLDLFGQKEVSNKIPEFTREIKDRLLEIQDKLQDNMPNYKKNLSRVIKRFFSVGGKIPKRYIYLPVSNQFNISEIEKINSNNHLDMLLKIKNGVYAELTHDDQELFNYLLENGYTLTKEQYVKNICVNVNGKEVPIDQELTNIDMIDIDKKKKALEKQKDAKIIEKINLDIIKKDKFKKSFLTIVSQIKQNSSIVNNSVIILTWIPRLVMAQSTNTIWKSCMTYSFDNKNHGVNVHYVKKGIEEGVFIAWLVKLDDKHVKKPMARALIKPTGSGDSTLYWPSKIYTESGEMNLINLFDKAVKKYCFLKQKNLFGDRSVFEIKFKTNVYDDGDSGKKILVFGVAKKEIEDKNFNPENFIIDYLSPNSTLFDFEDTDIGLLLNNKVIIDFINTETSNVLIDIYYHFLIERIISSKKFVYFNDFFKGENNKKVKEHIFARIFDDTKIKNMFLNNNNAFKYFLNICYEKDYLKNIKEKDLDRIKTIFINDHDNCSLYPLYGKYLKSLYDHFGRDLYPTVMKDDIILRKLFYTQLKVNEILPIYRDFNLNIEFYGVLLYRLFTVNRDNFYAFYKLANYKNMSVLGSQLIEIIINSLNNKNYKDLDEILNFIKKEKIYFKKESYEIIPNYTKPRMIKGLYNLIFEKKQSMIPIYKQMLDFGFNFVELLNQTPLNSIISEQSTNLHLIYNFFKDHKNDPVIQKEYEALTAFIISKEDLVKKILIPLLDEKLKENAPYNKIIEIIMLIPISESNRTEELGGIGDYILEQNLDKKQIDELFELLNERFLLIRPFGNSFLHILMSDNVEYYKKSFSNGKLTINNVLTSYILSVVNKLFDSSDSKSWHPDKGFYKAKKNLYFMQDKLIKFIENNIDKFEKEEVKFKMLIETMCRSRYSMIVLISILKSLEKTLNINDLDITIEKYKDRITYGAVLGYIQNLYDSDGARTLKDLKNLNLIFDAIYFHDFTDKIYFLKKYFHVFFDNFVSKKGRRDFLKRKCMEFITNSDQAGEILNFYDINDIDMFISFFKKYKMEGFLRKIIKSILTEDPTEEMINFFPIYKERELDDVSFIFINFLKMKKNNNPLVPYIDKQDFLKNILLFNRYGVSSLNIDALGVVMEKNDIDKLQLKDIVINNFKNNYSFYSDSDKNLLTSKLSDVFGKKKIDDLKRKIYI